jgi:hypothetical protein
MNWKHKKIEKLILVDEFSSLSNREARLLHNEVVDKINIIIDMLNDPPLEVPNKSSEEPQILEDQVAKYIRKYRNSESMTDHRIARSILELCDTYIRTTKNDDESNTHQQNERMRQWFKERTGEDVALSEQMKIVDHLIDDNIFRQQIQRYWEKHY